MTLSIIFAALLGSKPLRWALGAFAAFGGYTYWVHHQRNIGAARVTAKIEAKADKNAALADSVRDDVAVGKSGVRGRYQRPD